MAAGIRERAGVDVGLGITGHRRALPAAATSSPSARWWWRRCARVARRSGRAAILGDRAQIKFQGSQAALDLLRRHLERLEAMRLFVAVDLAPSLCVAPR